MHCCRLPDSASRGVVFRLRISPRIRSQNRNGSKCSVRDLCRTDLCKNPRKSASLPCPFNGAFFPALWLKKTSRKDTVRKSRDQFHHSISETFLLRTPVKPKARQMTQHGGTSDWLEESDPSGSYLCCEGRSMPPSLTDSTYRLPWSGAAQLRAPGKSSCCC
jgi:hypothetical protein